MTLAGTIGRHARPRNLDDDPGGGAIDGRAVARARRRRGADRAHDQRRRAGRVVREGDGDDQAAATSRPSAVIRCGFSRRRSTTGGRIFHGIASNPPACESEDCFGNRTLGQWASSHPGVGASYLEGSQLWQFPLNTRPCRKSLRHTPSRRGRRWSSVEEDLCITPPPRTD